MAAKWCKSYKKFPCGWSARPPVRRIYGNLPAKSQKKSVQIAKYLIQYARLRRCVKKKRPNWLRNVMPWWLSATREARIRGRLAMICRQYCKNVVLIDSAAELDMLLLSNAKTVGITAGASTPAWIIKEVNNKMSEEMKVETAMEENFAELLEQSLKTLNNGG